MNTRNDYQPPAVGRRHAGTGYPFYFRAGNLPLYGFLHEPPDSLQRRTPALICHAAGHEYERCHRALYQLAEQLSRAGCSVLRFDYAGTGDSAGDYADVSPAQWRQDIHDAAAELVKLTGSERFAVVGCRVGATLAWDVIQAGLATDAVVLLGAIDSGAVFVEDCIAMDREARTALGQTVPAGEPSEALGYPLGQDMLGGLRSLELVAPVVYPESLVIDRESPGEASRIVSQLRSGGGVVEHHIDSAVAVWHQDALNTRVPYALLQQVTAWLGERGHD